MTSHAHGAGLFNLDDGFDTMDGHLAVPVDEYGSFGRGATGNFDDTFQPASAQVNSPSYLAGAFMFVTTGTTTSRVLLSEDSAWANFLEAPPNVDGLFGSHTNLARTITTPFPGAGTGTTATSAFGVTAIELDISVALTQTVTTNLGNATSLLTQVYRFRNDHTAAVDIAFHAAWEVDITFASMDFEDDVVGIVPGLCAIYMRNPTSTTAAVALSSGTGTTLTTPPYYYAGKRNDVPSMGTTAIQPLTVVDANQHIWLNNGMPASWRNYVSGPGYNAVGDSGTAYADATMGLEWHFTLAAGAEETIDVRRHYGTIGVPCGVPASCGNNVTDTGELCDGTDTATCNGGTCLATQCGDGYWNQTANEACETGGVDSDTCNGSMCTAPVCGDRYINAAANEICDDGEETAACNANCQPAACGDGYVNAAAGEECEDGELCDVTTCTVVFTVGGGCAGCGARGGAPTSLWLAGLALVLSARRRRRARRA